MDKLNIPEMNKILVVRIGKIGDIIATSFVFEVIKANSPYAEITLLTKETNRNVLKYNNKIDSIIYVGSGLKRYFKLFSLRRKKFDLILDFNDNPSRTTKMIFSSFNARFKCGYNFPLYNQLLDIAVKQPDKEKTHIIDRMRSFLEDIGYTCREDLVKPFMYIGDNEEKEIDALLSKFKGRKIIAVNISAGAGIRFWNSENWIGLIKKIHQLDMNFAFVLLSVKEDMNEAEEIKSNFSPDILIKSGFDSFQHFAAAIKASRLLITPDTSAVHAAASFGVPVVALYPKSDWNFASWRPYKIAAKAILSKEDSVNAISIDEVFNNFVELNKEINVNG